MSFELPARGTAWKAASVLYYLRRSGTFFPKRLAIPPDLSNPCRYSPRIQNRTKRVPKTYKLCFPAAALFRGLGLSFQPRPCLKKGQHGIRGHPRCARQRTVLLSCTAILLRCLSPRGARCFTPVHEQLPHAYSPPPRGKYRYSDPFTRICDIDLCQGVTRHLFFSRHRKNRARTDSRLPKRTLFEIPTLEDPLLQRASGEVNQKQGRS